MSFRDKYGRWALVAGASEGLGAEFARQLGAEGLNLVLLARRAEKLDEVAAEVRAKSGVEVRSASIDLGAPDLLERVRAATAGLDVGLVVYNAALSTIGPFLEQPIEKMVATVEINCRGPVVLAHEFGRRMAARGRGGILLMSSLAGTQGSPLVATYAATKAFNLVFAESLWDELRARGVDVLACRAGATRTPGLLASKPAAGMPIMEPAPVVADALAALGKRPSTIPGATNRAAAFLLGHVLPRRTAVAIMGRQMRRIYGR